MYGEILDAETERVAKEVVDAIFQVHRELGPGLLECVYEEALCYELASRQLDVLRQALVPVHYHGARLSNSLRLDILVENCVIIEVKAVEKMDPLFKAQLFTYLKLSGKRLGILVNFNVKLVKDSIERVIR